MGQRLDLLISDPDEQMDELVRAMHEALNSQLDPHVLAGLLLEGAVQAIARIPGEAQMATRQAFIGLAITRLAQALKP